MDKRIIYQNDGGGVSIIIPSPDVGLTIEQIAAKDVPPKQVFIKTGQAILTKKQYEEDPEYFEGLSVGDAYAVGYWEAKPRPFKIVNVSDIPTDRSERSAWTVNEADLTDGVGT